jgi:phage baseplate assembly protein gpV
MTSATSRVVAVIFGTIFAVAMTACGSPTADHDAPSTESSTNTVSYQVTGGDGKYQFSGVMCSADSGELPPAVGGVRGSAILIPSAEIFSMKWIYGDGGGEKSDVATGTITDLTVDGDAISITASYSGTASVGDAGKNTKISGEMVFTGTKTETPKSCTE